MKREELIKELFSRALEQQAPGERALFLEEACRSDLELRQQVESLLGAHGRAGDFLQRTSQMSPPDVTRQRAGMDQKTMMISQAVLYGLRAILYFLLTGRPPFVAASPLDTLVQVLGYSLLVLDDFSRTRRLVQPNWHAAFLVLLVLTGCAVAYQVHRVRALSRFYNRGAW
ncbi:MAG: hypothetical protein ABSH34_26060 [Verrucomicrobiota bacterium]|jgi:hypothetical protein